LKKLQVERLSIFQLSAEFEKAATQHRRAFDEGDYRVSNKLSEFLDSLWGEFKRRGSEGQTAILNLMKRDDPGVRLFAAFRALSFAPDEAERVLQEVAAGPPSLTRLDAAMTLQEWRKGNLKPGD